MNIALLFEQSGHFKKVLQKHGHNAKDFDIENQFGETDYIIDLFSYITETEMNIINKADLVIAFFPCTYFSRNNNMYFNRTCINFKNKTDDEIEMIIKERLKMRNYYTDVLLQMISKIKAPLIIENPASQYIKDVLKIEPVSMSRNKYGDYFMKPTYFFCYNGAYIDKSNMKKIQNPEQYSVYKANGAKSKPVRKGIERSLISPLFIENLLQNTYVNGINVYYGSD